MSESEEEDWEGEEDDFDGEDDYGYPDVNREDAAAAALAPYNGVFAQVYAPVEDSFVTDPPGERSGLRHVHVDFRHVHVDFFESQCVFFVARDGVPAPCVLRLLGF